MNLLTDSRQKCFFFFFLLIRSLQNRKSTDGQDDSDNVEVIGQLELIDHRQFDVQAKDAKTRRKKKRKQSK